MVRKGFTCAGAQRWFCRSCAVTQIRRRTDNAGRTHRRVLASWMTGFRSLAEIAARRAVSREHLSRRLREAWHEVPPPPVITSWDDVLVLDARGVGDGVVCLSRAQWNDPPLPGTSLPPRIPRDGTRHSDSYGASRASWCPTNKRAYGWLQNGDFLMYPTNAVSHISSAVRTVGLPSVRRHAQGGWRASSYSTCRA